MAWHGMVWDDVMWGAVFQIREGSQVKNPTILAT